jgi:hypothetical protein
MELGDILLRSRNHDCSMMIDCRDDDRLLGSYDKGDGSNHHTY